MTDTTTAVRFYFDTKIERFTSYGNQLGLIARDMPGAVCVHGVTVSVWDGCAVCRMSGTPLVRV